jgi:energy-coupling factor transport system ATP-binding protein
MAAGSEAELSSRRQGILQPAEVAAAAVMASTAVVLVVVGSVIRHVGGSIEILTVVPFGIVAYRHRPRAVTAALVAGLVLTFLLVGTGGASKLVAFALLGAFVGEVKRRGRGKGTVLALSLVLGPIVAVLVDLVLTVFASYRTLTLATLRNTVSGFDRTLRHVGFLRPSAQWIDTTVSTLVRHWELSFAVVSVVGVPAGLLVAWLLVGAVLDRLNWVASPDRLLASSVMPGDKERIAPLPVSLVGVAVRYPHAEGDALVSIDLELPEGQFVVVVGENGSGKSTLARVLAGAAPTAGCVQRPGAAGLGEIGGTALIMQRPDAQVLGARVADDVVWGLPAGEAVDVEGLLESVGLAGAGQQDTATLSGGQLQRLAVAAALARRPRLLISDESTAMVDPSGRADLIRLLADLPHSQAMTVVHVTHGADETAAADRVVRLEAGRIVDDRPGLGRLPPVVGDSLPAELWRRGRETESEATPPLLVVDHVSHTYAFGTPWEHRALREVSLALPAGDGLAVVGDNGSGKSTLAWILAGLIRPSEGSCLVDGRPVHRQPGVVGLSFQHSRLQLQRPTVGADIAEAAGWTATKGGSRDAAEVTRDLSGEIGDALVRVGLDPSLGRRSIDQLSGGQMRRVAIAGLLARRPRVMVLDEPLAGLDTPSRTGLLDLLTRLRNDLGLTLVVVSHDFHGLSTVCSRVIQLDDGRLVADSDARLQPSERVA